MDQDNDTIRQLASLQTIDKIEKLEGSDSLYIATVLGWNVIVRTGEVELDQLAIYCEIDSMLPGNADWLPEAIKKRVETQSNKDYFRVKTIKLRGALSQGVIVPIPNCLLDQLKNDGVQPYKGLDVTNYLKVIKYEKYADDNVNNGGKVGEPKIKTFPDHLVDKTEEYRIQSKPTLLEKLYKQKYVITEKHDGTSATYVINPDNGEFLVCSRNQLRRNEFDCKYWLMATKYNIEQILRENPNLAIQGEICGPNIQKNLLGYKDHKLCIFTITDIKTKSRMKHNDMVSFCKNYGLDTVNVVEIGDSFEYTKISDLLIKAEGKYPNTKNEREGIVVRSLDGSVSFKVISNKYLLKNDQ